MNCSSEEFGQRENVGFVLGDAVVEELQGGPVIVNLPEEIREGDGDEDEDGECGPAAELPGEEDAALGSEDECGEE